MALDLEGRVLGVRIGVVVKRFQIFPHTFERKWKWKLKYVIIRILCCFLAKLTSVGTFSLLYWHILKDEVYSGLTMAPGWRSWSWAYSRGFHSYCQRYGTYYEFLNWGGPRCCICKSIMLECLLVIEPHNHLCPLGQFWIIRQKLFDLVDFSPSRMVAQLQDQGSFGWFKPRSIRLSGISVWT